MRSEDTPEGLTILPPIPEMEEAVRRGDDTYDGIFLYGVRTTGIFCRPGCTTPRRAPPAHCEYFRGVREALQAGYRPCLRCRPEVPTGTPPPWLDRLVRLMDSDPSRRPDPETLAEVGTHPGQARDWFMHTFGMTPADWTRRRRLAVAFAALQDGGAIGDAVSASGYESHTGFRQAWGDLIGQPPGHDLPPTARWIGTFPSPLGLIRAIADARAVVRLEFADRVPEAVAANNPPMFPVPNQVLTRLGGWLEHYFSGSTPCPDPPAEAARGTSFQRRVWDELRTIPHGESWSYARLANALGSPSSTRAVARANAMNPVCLLIPCHRVIGSDGNLGGYGGGIWRKRLLLELERTGRFPGRHR